MTKAAETSTGTRQETTSSAGTTRNRGSNDTGGGSSLERVTVNLTPRSVAALETLAKLTGETKTDIINKTLQIQAYLQEQIDNGGKLYLREADSDELERIRFL